MARYDAAVEILKKLVAFDTTTAQSNLDLIAYVQGYLEQYEIKSHLIYSEDKTRANLWATVGNDSCPGIILSGHTDVVPVEKDGWNFSPWQLTEHDGKLYGRGSCDMKGFLAVCLAHVPELVAAKKQTPVHLCFSYDEEIGCMGVHSLVEDLAKLHHLPKIAIIGEPTMMQLVRGHKGKMLVSCTVSGHAGHSSAAPQHLNAVEYGARAIAIIADHAKNFAENGPYNHDYTIPHSTMLTTLADGGIATNITPDSCRFVFEIRNIPEQPAETIFAEVRHQVENLFSATTKEHFPQASFSWKVENRYPGMAVDENSEGYQFVKALHPEVAACVSYGTEGGIFQQEGKIPAVVCGPGNIAQAHMRNEYIEKDQIVQCSTFIEKLFAAL